MAVRTNILLKLSNFVDSVITFAKLQNIATNKILGRTTAGSGVIEELDIANYSNKLIPLTTTFADCENTTSEINIITVTVPANTLELGDNIFINFVGRRLQNSGGPLTLTQILKINSSAIVNITANNISNSSATSYLMQNILLNIQDISSNNLTFRTTSNTSAITAINATNSLALGTSAIASGADATLRTLGSIDKTATITIVASTQWTSANANAYIRVDEAQAYIIKKAV